MAAQIISLIGILIALALIIILSYKGVNLLIVGPLCALVCCLFAWGSIDVVQEGMLTSYASGFGDYAADYFIMFALGAIFGRLTGDSGTGKTIALKLAGLLNKNPSENAVGSYLYDDPAHRTDHHHFDFGRSIFFRGHLYDGRYYEAVVRGARYPLAHVSMRYHHWLAGVHRHYDSGVSRDPESDPY